MAQTPGTQERSFGVHSRATEATAARFAGPRIGGVPRGSRRSRFRRRVTARESGPSCHASVTRHLGRPNRPNSAEMGAKTELMFNSTRRWAPSLAVGTKRPANRWWAPFSKRLCGGLRAAHDARLLGSRRAGPRHCTCIQCARQVRRESTGSRWPAEVRRGKREPELPRRRTRTPAGRASRSVERRD